MDIYELHKRFWQISEILPITGDEALLYFYLVEQANIRGWVDTLELSTRTICMRLCMTNKKLCEVRNRLQQKGLIEFEEGNRRKATPKYSFFGFSQKLKQKPKQKLKSKPKSESKQKPLYNTRDNNTKDNIPPSPPKGEAISLNARAREYFESHYKILFGDSYYWSAKDAGSMSQVLQKLKFQREKKGLTNSDEEVLFSLKYLLSSIKEGWIFQNFSMTNINSKFNEIVSQARIQSNGNNQKNSSRKQEANDFALQQFAEYRQQRESGVDDEVPKPF